MLDRCLKKIVQETYENVKEEGTHKYKDLGENDFLEIAQNIIDYDEFWDMLDGFIFDELRKYEEE